MSIQLLVLQEDVQRCQPAAKAEGNGKTDKGVDDDVLLVGFSGLAVVLCAAALTLNMREHGRSERAAPPGVTDLPGIALSAVGAWGVLSWVLHETIPP